MDNRFSVQLTGPAKIGGKWRKPGELVEVTPDLARELSATGVIAHDGDLAPGELASGMPGLDEAVAEQAKLLAEAVVVAAVETAAAELITDRDAARSRAADAEAEVSRQHARIMTLEAEIADLEAARDHLAADLAALKAPASQVDEAAADPAPKAARKKAAEAKG